MPRARGCDGRHTCKHGPQNQEARIRERSDTLTEESGQPTQRAQCNVKMEGILFKEQDKSAFKCTKMQIFPSVSPFDMS